MTAKPRTSGLGDTACNTTEYEAVFGAWNNIIMQYADEGRFKSLIPVFHFMKNAEQKMFASNNC